RSAHRIAPRDWPACACARACPRDKTRAAGRWGARFGWARRLCAWLHHAVPPAALLAASHHFTWLHHAPERSPLLATKSRESQLVRAFSYREDAGNLRLDSTAHRNHVAARLRTTSALRTLVSR